jgi:peptide/nickel transport system substrate-binding protein
MPGRGRRTAAFSLDDTLYRVYPLDALDFEPKKGAVMNQAPLNFDGQFPSLSRRRLMGAVASTGALAAVSTLACSSRGKPAAPSSGAQSARQPKRGGVVSYSGGVGSQDTGGRPLDPNTQTQGGAKSFALFYERLVAYNIQTYDVEPELAQKWEQPSPTDYVFNLQPNVKWQNKAPVNGRPMTTDDILWSLTRAASNDPKFLSRSLLAQVDKIEAPDNKTIRVTTKGPDSSTLKRLATEQVPIMPQEAVEKFPNPLTAEGVVGTGPFVLKSLEVNVGADYVRNPDYWKPDLPYLDEFRTRHFADLQTANAAFVAGQIDVSLLSGVDGKAYIAKQGSGFTPAWAPDDTIQTFMLPNLKTKPLNDPRVTRALRLLIDHDDFINTWALSAYGRGAHGSSLPIALQDWDLTQDEYKKQLEWKQPKDDAVKEAMSLLAAAGFSKQNPIRFSLIVGTDLNLQAATQLTQAQWKRLSQGAVDVDIKVLDTTAYTTARANHNFAYGIFGYSAGPVEPDIWLTTTWHTGGSQNFMDYSDPQLDTMIDKQRSIFDEKQRKAAIREIVLYMIDHAPSTVGAAVYFLHGVQPKIQGYIPETHFLNGRDLKTVWVGT